MKISFYLSFIFMLFNFCTVAQSNHTCGTTIQEQATTYDFVQKQRKQPQNSLRTAMNEVPVRFHFIGTNNGLLTPDSAKIFDELQIVNNHFAGANIEFVHCGNINYIHDNNYLTFVKGVDEVLCDIHDKPGVINIYFAPNVERADGTGLCGYAYNFDIKQRVLMDNNCATNTSTLAHELGHSFSLLHTHTTSNGQEFANGSNCSIAGDLLCDTPADPRLDSDINVNADCEYTGTETDNQGNTYDPDTENLMSYSRKACRIHFSDQQLLQMEDYYLLEGSILACTADPVVTPTEELFGLNIDVFPNPSQSSIFIKNIPAAANLDLIDVNGKVIWTNSTNQPVEQYELKVFQELSKGMYFLRISAEDKIFTEKIIRM